MNMIRKKHDIVFLFLNIIFMLCISAEVVTAENIDPDNNDSQYAYGENVGCSILSRAGMVGMVQR